jgi:DNA polymerase III epsilon subunit-like protein
MTSNKIHISKPTDSDLVVYWDLETTGLSVYKDQIIQIGAFVAACSSPINAPEATFSRIVRTSIPLSEFIVEYTGVTQTAVTAACTFPTVFGDFEIWLTKLRATRRSRGVTLVAFNGERFDLPLLLEECRRHGLTLNSSLWRTVHFFDPTRWRKLVKWTGPAASGSLTVSYTACFAGDTFSNAHDALGDARALGRLCHDGYHLQAAGSWDTWGSGFGSQTLQEAHLRQLQMLIVHRLKVVKDPAILLSFCAAFPDVFSPTGQVEEVLTCSTQARGVTDENQRPAKRQHT